MKLKPLVVALATAGVVAVGSTAAIVVHANPVSWFGSSTQAAPANAAISAPVVAAAAQAAIAPLPPGATPNYRAIVQQAGPAVVGVTVEGTEKVSASDLPPGMQDDPFFQFFRGMPGFQGRMPGQRGGEMPVRGQGSGFIISADGLVLTNAHVVRDMKDVTVKLSDRREYKAKVLGTDSVTDIAVLRIDAKNLPTVRLGDAQQLQVGRQFGGRHLFGAFDRDADDRRAGLLDDGAVVRCRARRQRCDGGLRRGSDGGSADRRRRRRGLRAAAKPAHGIGVDHEGSGAADGDDACGRQSDHEGLQLHVQGSFATGTDALRPDRLKLRQGRLGHG